MTISSRFPSWNEYHLSKKKEAKGFPLKTDEEDGFVAPRPSPMFRGNQFSHMRAVDWFQGKALLLLSAGGDQVKIIHNCFKADVKDGTGVSVFGIFGNRFTSPIKRLDMGQAITPDGSLEKGKRNGLLQLKACRNARTPMLSNTHLVNRTEEDTRLMNFGRTPIAASSTS